MTRQSGSIGQQGLDLAIITESLHMFGYTSGDFIYRHHEVHRTKLYVPDETTFPIPLNYVDVCMDNASDYTLNDYWNHKREVWLSEERVGTTRFQFLRIKLPEGYQWVDGRPTQVPKHCST